jgi:hypothetical protein
MAHLLITEEAREICAKAPGVTDTAIRQIMSGQLDLTSQIKAVERGILRGMEIAAQGIIYDNEVA